MRLDVAPPNLTNIDSPQALIERFVVRYGEAHLRLLYHAAFPLSLTPDLLYRLWANIQKDNSGQNSPIPWIAVSDVLLSSFCEKVGYELYELKPDLRRELLRRLSNDPRFGEKRLKELAEFMLAYTESFLHSPDSAERNFAQVQRWGAIAQLQPNTAARELAQALTYAYQNDAADLNRIARIAERLSEPLADYPMLLDYARGMARYARGDEAGAVTHFQWLVIGKFTPSVEGILLALPKDLPLDQLYPEKSRLPMTSRVWVYRAVLIFVTLIAVIPLFYAVMNELQVSQSGDSSTSPNSTPPTIPSPPSGTRPSEGLLSETSPPGNLESTVSVLDSPEGSPTPTTTPSPPSGPQPSEGSLSETSPLGTLESAVSVLDSSEGSPTPTTTPSPLSGPQPSQGSLSEAFPPGTFRNAVPIRNFPFGDTIDFIENRNQCQGNRN